MKQLVYHNDFKRLFNNISDLRVIVDKINDILELPTIMPINVNFIIGDLKDKLDDLNKCYYKICNECPDLDNFIDSIKANGMANK